MFGGTGNPKKVKTKPQSEFAKRGWKEAGGGVDYSWAMPPQRSTGHGVGT